MERCVWAAARAAEEELRSGVRVDARGQRRAVAAAREAEGPAAGSRPTGLEIGRIESTQRRAGELAADVAEAIHAAAWPVRPRRPARGEHPCHVAAQSRSVAKRTPQAARTAVRAAGARGARSPARSAAMRVASEPWGVASDPTPSPISAA